MKNNRLFLSAFMLMWVAGLLACSSQPAGVEKDMAELLARPRTYVGSENCESCHLEHYGSWKSTLHSRTMQSVTDNLDALVADVNPAEIRLELKQVESQLKVPVEDIYIPEISSIKYVIGMQWEQGYLVEKDEKLYAAPIQYSARSEHWTVSREKDWDKRPWIIKCAGCHATGVDLKNESFTEASVGCEACHGPGSHHVALPETKVFEKHQTIVNPSHLAAGFRTQICGSCHSRGRSKKVEGVDWPVGYQPGRALGRYYQQTSFAAGDSEFVYPNEFAKGRYMQFNDWKKSSHAREGVSCTSCHYVHQLGVPPTQYQTKGAGSQQCLNCHKVINNNMAHSIHSFANCIGCHMPRIVKNGESGNRSHAFRVLLPKDTLEDPRIPNSCQTCHRHKDADLAALQALYDGMTKRTLLRVHQTRPTP